MRATGPYPHCARELTTLTPKVGPEVSGRLDHVRKSLSRADILKGNATPIGHLAGEAYGWPVALCPSWVLGTEYMRHRARIRGQLVA